MINYDAFMIADSDRGISRLKLNGLLIDGDDFDLFKVAHNVTGSNFATSSIKVNS